LIETNKKAPMKEDLDAKMIRWLADEMWPEEEIELFQELADTGRLAIERGLFEERALELYREGKISLKLRPKKRADGGGKV
jgi:hypothetical protein